MSKIKEAFFIMRLWQTGNVGSHNIAKIEGQKQFGYRTYEEAEKDIPHLLKAENWDIHNYPVTIMKIYNANP